jgi:radical SAM superfamily enzyme YgiQ (UPF0313 family)
MNNLKKHKVVLAYPRVDHVPQPPLGLLMIAAVLERAEFDVKVIDPFETFTIEQIVDLIIIENPVIVGLSSNTAHIEKALKISEAIKLRDKTIPIIIGGVHITCKPAEVLNNDSIDYVVIGEGEDTAVELCTAIVENNVSAKILGIGFKQNNEQVFTGKRPLIEDLNTLPFPARHLLDSAFYFKPPRIRGVWTKSTVVLMTGRGCPYQCIFCGSNVTFGRNVRRRSPENVMAELKLYRERYDVDGVWFADDTFTLNHAWVTKLCDLIINEGWKDFQWVCQARVNTITEDIVRKMKSAGCKQLEFGVESGSPKVLKILKKGADISLTKEAFAICHKVGMRSLGTFIVGTPGETVEDLQMTEDLVKEIKPDYAEFFFAMPFPCTELAAIIMDNGFDIDTIPISAWKSTLNITIPFMNIGCSKEELIFWKNKLNNQFFVKNYVLSLKNIKTILGLIVVIGKGSNGFIKGIKRSLQTRSFYDIIDSMILEYRKDLYFNSFPDRKKFK